MSRAAWLMASLGWLTLGQAQAWEVVVAPGEGEAGITRALAALAKARTQHPDDKVFRLVLEPGEYVLTAPMAIGPQHSGTSSVPTLIEARIPGTVHLVGGPRLALQSRSTERVRFVPDVTITRLHELTAGDLYVGGHRAQLARSPNVGQDMLVAARTRVLSRDSLALAEADVAPVRKLLEDDAARAIVHLMHSWTHSEHRTNRLGPEDRALALEPASKWPLLSFGRSQRHALLNVVGALDAPNEWLIHQGVIDYIPTPSFKEDADVRWPRLTQLLRIGDASADQPVHDVLIKGLRLAYAGLPYGIQGFVDNQAASAVGAAVEINHAQRISLLDCQIQHTGGYGIWLKREVRDSLVQGCRLDDLGAGGIRVGETMSDASAQATGANRLVGNRITRTGARFPGAVGIWLGKTSDNVVQDNLIAQTTYSGISVGWQWGYAPSHASNNRIRGNVLYDIGREALSDLGGIYTLGLSRGTEITGNYIQRVRDYGDYGVGGWGIYNDEGTADILVADNVVVDARSGAYHLHYGRDNTVRGNLFALGKDAEVRWSDVSRSGRWLMTNNTIAPDGATPIDVRGPDVGLVQRGNVLIKAASVKLSLGSQPGQLSWSGHLGDATQVLTWQGVVRHAQQLLQGAPAALSTVVTRQQPLSESSLDLSATAPGERPAGLLQMYPAQPQQAITTVVDADGERCLQFNDGVPGLRSFEPYAFFAHSAPVQANARLRFSIKLDERSKLAMEWRDTTTGQYNVGPNLVFENGRLLAQGQTVMSWPAQQWLDVEVTHNGQGKGWTLRTRAGRATWRSFGPWPDRGPQTPERWAWIGWYSHAEWPTQTCLKQVSFSAAAPKR